MRDIQYMIDVMTAFRDGKRVECWSRHGDDRWGKILQGHQFDWSSLDYRIAPEPRKAREFMVLCDDKGEPANGSIVGAKWYKFREVLDGS